MPRRQQDATRTDVALARRLLFDQLPAWAELPLRQIEHFGTDHDIYRLGEDMSIRLPRTEWAAALAHKESRLLPQLAPVVSLTVPQVLALGEPTPYYPLGWSVQSWLPGRDLVGRALDGDTRLAGDLAAFVGSLRAVAGVEAPPLAAGARGGDLAVHDADVEERIAELGDRVDAAALARTWAESRAAVPPAERCWTHGDLLPGNLLTTEGILTAAIDLGALNVTDPALDLTPCWYVFGGVETAAARRFLGDLSVTRDEVLRARGWAQLQALNALPFYWDTNPGMVQLASTALRLISSGM